MILKLYRQTVNATKYSVDGLKFLLSNEFAARVEVYAFCWFLALLFFTKSSVQYLVTGTVLFLILLAVEALNTAIEVIIDKITPEISDTGKRAKDLGSFAVMCLLMSCGIFIIFMVSNAHYPDVVSRMVSPLGQIILAVAFLAFSANFMLRSSMPTGLKVLIQISMSVLLIGLYIFMT